MKKMQMGSAVFKRLANHNAFIIFSALLILIILYPPRSLFNLHTDDFLIRAYVTGDHPDFLQIESASQKLADAYYFFGENRNKTQLLKEYGALPWWSDDKARMSMFRPISAATHYIDHVVLKGNFFLIQLHSFLWLSLLFFSIVTFYKQFNFSPWVLVLASSIFIIDLSHMNNFYWLAARNIFIASAFGLLAISFHKQWREKNNLLYFVLAILFFGLSLLSAEAGIATGAYLLSYALFLDNKKIVKGLLSIFPYGLLVVVWRVAYQSFEYGSINISLYVDPVNSLEEFLLSLFTSALLTITAIVSATGLISSGMGEKAEFWYLVFGFCLFTFSTILIAPLLIAKTKQAAQVRFFYFGFLFSIIPFCALSTYTTRNGVFAYIGFSALLAILIYQYSQAKDYKLPKRLFIIIALLFHLFIPLLYSLFVSITFEKTDQLANKAADLEHALPSESNNYTVYLNYPSEVNAMFLPYTWKAEGYDEPMGLIRFAPGLNSYTLTRISERSFILKSDYHFVLNQHALLKSQYDNIPNTGLLYGLKEAMGFTANNARQYQVFEKIKLNNYSVEVLATKDTLPSELLIGFSEHIDMHRLEWRLWRWDSLSFESISMLNVESSMRVLNQWDEMLQQDNVERNKE